MDDLLSSTLESIAKDSHLFCLLTNEELKRVAESLEREHFKAGDVLFREGDPGDFIAIIGSGSVSVSKSTEFAGKNVILAKNGKGSFIGELSTVDGHPRSATVTAMEETDVMILTRRALEEINTTAPVIGLKIYKGLIRVLGLKLRQSAARISQIF